jgi:hypothetical protein
MTTVLERYGFGAILFNRNGYDNGGSVNNRGVPGGGMDRNPLQTRQNLFVLLCSHLRRRAAPDFDSRWYDLEGIAQENGQWSSGDAEVRIYNPDRRS